MKKLILQALLLVAMFFGTWFLLNQIDWMRLFKVQKWTDKTEEKLGDAFWDLFQKTEHEVQDTFLLNTVDSLLTRIGEHNYFDTTHIKIHILENNEVNALALPNGHLIVFTGLIAASENPEELCGVICHEVAHIQLNHVMQKLVKEVGLSVLISMTTGNGGTEILQETAKMLSSTAFDRNLEKEADLQAVEYLQRANISPEPFANFLSRLADDEPAHLSKFTWINTHPDTKQRAEYIMETANNRTSGYDPVLAPNTWAILKESLKGPQYQN